jgi:uncharacterized protein YkwD
MCWLKERLGDDTMWHCVKRIVLGVMLAVSVSCSAPLDTPSSDLIALSSPLSVASPAPVVTDTVRPALSIPTVTPVSAATGPGVIEPMSAAPQVVQHTVQPGETLLGLALQYGVPMAAIQLQNQLGSGMALRAGQVLDIPPGAGWEQASPFWVVYTVQEGATLSGIAALYALDLSTLRAVNDMAADDLLRVGQSLILPLEAPAEEARAPDPTPTPVLPAPTPAPVPGASESPQPTIRATALPAAPSADVAAWPAEVFRLINEVRAAHGLPPYVYDDTLARAAQLHGQDCQQRGSCNHTGSDGSNVKARVLRAGYDAAGWAECIVYSSSPQEAVDWWMDEVPPNDAHRRTLLSTWVTEIGIAVVPTAWDYDYFIADFGRPRE